MFLFFSQCEVYYWISKLIFRVQIEYFQCDGSDFNRFRPLGRRYFVKRKVERQNADKISYKVLRTLAVTSSLNLSKTVKGGPSPKIFGVMNIFGSVMIQNGHQQSFRVMTSSWGQLGSNK